MEVVHCINFNDFPSLAITSPMETSVHFSEILKNIALIITCVVGVLSLIKWRVEFIGKKNIDLAEDTLVLFYQAKDAISAIRSPFGYEEEGKTRKKGENETESESKALNRAFSAIERFNNRKDVFDKLYASRYRFQARFGKEAAEPFDEIHWAINKVIVSSRLLATYWTTNIQIEVRENEREAYRKLIRDSEKIFWEMSTGDDDPIIPRVNAAIESMDKFCKKVIK